MPLRLAPLALLLLIAFASCATAPAAPPPPPALRFAVIAAPEIGADPKALETLQAAITRVSIEPGLAFILVPGPLLAPAASKDALEDLRSTLDYATIPLYVAFAPVTSATAGAAPAVSAEDVLAALEAHGPGAARRVAYRVTPPTASEVSVVALGLDGNAPAEPEAPEARIAVAFAARGVVSSSRSETDLLVLTSPDATPVMRLAPVVRHSLRRERSHPWHLDAVVPPISTSRAIAIIRVELGEATLSLIPVDGHSPPTVLPPVPLPLRPQAPPTPGG